MTHPLVTQLRFARSEWLRALGDVSAEDAVRRCGSMNCIGWTIGHLAWQENRYWLIRAQGKNAAPHLDALTGYGAPPSTPPLDEMWATWRAVTEAADPFLDSLTTETLQAPMVIDGQPRSFSLGSLMLRTTYHYWFHIGETQAIRQVLGHTGLPDFVGDIDSEAPYRPERES